MVEKEEVKEVVKAKTVKKVEINENEIVMFDNDTSISEKSEKSEKLNPIQKNFD